MTTETVARPEPKRAEWQALVPLSIGRRGDKEKAADFVPRGETVWLTEEESARFLDPAQHKTAPIRPASERNQPLPHITARAMFGAAGRPSAAQFGAAPDPEGSSRVTVNPAEPENHPEAELLEVTDPDAGREGMSPRPQRRTR